MKIAFDTNILLDAVIRRKDAQAAINLMLVVAKGKAVGVITANSVTDFYYIARKNIGDEQARAALYDLISVFEVAPVDGEACSDALGLPMSDFEDAVLAACSKSVGAEYIVTRDEGLIHDEGCPVAAIRPEDLLNILRKEAADWPEGTEE